MSSKLVLKGLQFLDSERGPGVTVHGGPSKTRHKKAKTVGKNVTPDIVMYPQTVNKSKGRRGNDEKTEGNDNRERIRKRSTTSKEIKNKSYMSNLRYFTMDLKRKQNRKEQNKNIDPSNLLNYIQKKKRNTGRGKFSLGNQSGNKSRKQSYKIPELDKEDFDFEMTN